MQIDWPYFWMGPHHILSLYSGNGLLSDWQVHSGDTETGAEIRIPITNAILASRDVLPMFASIRFYHPVANATFNTRIIVSPDGKWTLWTYSENSLPSTDSAYSITSAFNSDVYLISADGLHHSRPKTECTNVSCVWLRDSKRWITLGGHWGTDALAPSPMLEVHSNADDIDFASVPISLPSSMALIGTTPEERVVAVDWHNPVHGRIAAAKFFPDPKNIIPTRYTIPIPPDGRAVPIAAPLISPKGQRIAWFVTMPSVPPGWPVTQKLWSIWKVRPQTLIALWTTRLDGSNPEEVGHYVQKDAEDLPSMLQWTPDSKMLSFRYQGALYSVPAL